MAKAETVAASINRIIGCPMLTWSKRRSLLVYDQYENRFLEINQITDDKDTATVVMYARPYNKKKYGPHPLVAKLEKSKREHKKKKTSV